LGLQLKLVHLGGKQTDLQQTVLLSHSVGATIALLAASQAPTYFAKVVLLTPSPCYLNQPSYYGGYERDAIEQLLTLIQTNRRG
jgi:sigma-B regulation protein RsbQ